jgi:hypothetical protein
VKIENTAKKDGTKKKRVDTAIAGEGTTIDSSWFNGGLSNFDGVSYFLKGYKIVIPDPPIYLKVFKKLLKFCNM